MVRKRIDEIHTHHLLKKVKQGFIKIIFFRFLLMGISVPSVKKKVGPFDTVYKIEVHQEACCGAVQSHMPHKSPLLKIP